MLHNFRNLAINHELSVCITHSPGVHVVDSVTQYQIPVMSLRVIPCSRQPVLLLVFSTRYSSNITCGTAHHVPPHVIYSLFSVFSNSRNLNPHISRFRKHFFSSSLGTLSSCRCRLSDSISRHAEFPTTTRRRLLVTISTLCEVDFVLWRTTLAESRALIRGTRRSSIFLDAQCRNNRLDSRHTPSNYFVVRFPRAFRIHRVEKFADYFRYTTVHCG